MTITEAFEAYQRDVIVFKGQSRKTEENHVICMRALTAYFGDIAVESLDFAMIRNWKEALSSKRSAETVRNYIIKLRVVLDYLQKRGTEVINPELIPVPKRHDKVPAFITKEEVSSMITACTRLRSKLIISLLYSSGIRVNELCSLNINDVTYDRFTIIGKGGKARLCFIDGRTMYLLQEYLSKRSDNNPALLVSQTGARVSATNVQLLVKTAAKNAGITKKVSPHTLRHTFATELLQSNTNIRYVQEMLGHSSILTTQMYTHVTNVDLEKVYRNKHHV